MTFVCIAAGFFLIWFSMLAHLRGSIPNWLHLILCVIGLATVFCSMAFAEIAPPPNPSQRSETMHYQVEHALSKVRSQEVGAIRRTLLDTGYYELRAANGDTRRIAAGAAHTVLANAGWPRYGSNAVLWVYAKPA